ncbi:MAG: hypothetical protein Athens071426_144 [Parcubacteria group bacterium Athens0714_26]|nr:MAG: hypothetical protein Athens101426_60 [Parcubacteria group bacterium Athens1014_26]TSD03655.1 MAG: hypothetical protein Athens071426_144 [Parcubacteria group bacterium Athens0714_26]
MQDTFKKVNLLLIKAGLFIVPLIPLLIFRSLFFPFITSKAFVFRIIIEIIFALWVALAIFYKEFRPKKNYLPLVIGGFIFVVTLATIFGVNPARSFWSNFERMEGLITYLHLFAYFLVLGNVFKKKDWFVLFNLFVFSGLVENIYAFLQKLGKIPSPQGGFRVDGTIGNPAYLAAYLIFILGFCIFLLLNSKEKTVRYFYGGMSLFTLAIIYFTASRGPALGVLGGLVLAAIMYLIFKKNETDKDKLYKKIILSCLAALTLVTGGIWGLKDQKFVQNSPVLSRLTSLSFNEKTVKSRFAIWKMSWQAVKERPILGWGPENYGVVFSKYYRPELWEQEPWFDRSHNIVFDWLINAGILGLLSYLSIFAVAFYYLWRNHIRKILPIESIILFSTILIVYFFQNLFVFDNIATYIGFFTILAFIYKLDVVYSEDGGEVRVTADSPQDKDRDKKIITEGFLLIVFAVSVYFINIKPILVNGDIISALQNQGDYNSLKIALAYFKEAISYDSFLGRQEVGEQLTRFALGVNSLPNADADFKNETLQLAITEEQKNVVQNNLDPRPYLFLGNLYVQEKMYDEALKVFNEALALSPLKQQILFELTNLYIKKGDYADAMASAKKAFDFASAYPQARMNLVAAYILNKQQAEADKLLFEAYGTVEVPENLLIQAYSVIKDYQRLLGIWRAFVKDDPNNFNYRFSLAGAYLLNNIREDAIAQLKEAIRIKPSFESEGNSYIQQIQAGKF